MDPVTPANSPETTIWLSERKYSPSVDDVILWRRGLIRDLEGDGWALESETPEEIVFSYPYDGGRWTRHYCLNNCSLKCELTYSDVPNEGVQTLDRIEWPPVPFGD